MTKGRLIRSLGLATGALLALTGSAQAADTTTYPQPYPLSDATRLSVQGEREGAAAAGDSRNGRATCRFPRQALSLKPHERAVELRQLSLNARTCRATFERGVPPKSARPNARDRQSGGSTNEAAAAGSVSASAAEGYRYGGTARAWYRDTRNGRTVNSVTSGGDWNVRRGCIGTSNLFFANRAYTRSGWDEVSHRWAFTDDRCEYVRSSTSTHFRDEQFHGCTGGPRVDAYYRSVRMVGYPDGRITGGRSSRIEPSCKDTLVAYFALYRR